MYVLEKHCKQNKITFGVFLLSKQYSNFVLLYPGTETKNSIFKFNIAKTNQQFQS